MRPGREEGLLLRDSEVHSSSYEAGCQVQDIGVEHVYPVSVHGARPIHVPNNVSRKTHLFDSCNPLVNIRNVRRKEMAIIDDDFV